MSEEPKTSWFKIILWSFIGLVILLGIWSSVTVISAGHRGVVTRFGEVTGRILDEGVHVILPWQIEKTWIVEVRVQKEQVDAAAASKDLQEVKSTIALNYHLQPDRVQWIYQNLGTDYKSRIIDPSIQESFKAVTAQFDASQLLQERPRVKEEARKILEERLHKNHIIVDDVSIVNFDFSTEFNTSIENKQVQSQNVQAAQFKLESARLDAEAMKVKAEAIAQNPNLIEYEAVLVQREGVAKWNGILPTYVGSNMMPFIGQINK